VDGAPFVRKIEGLDNAILAFLYVSFIADMEYPQVQLLLQDPGILISFSNQN
jgi:hypothetical protein